MQHRKLSFQFSISHYFPSAGVYAISEGVYLIRKTPDQLFSFNRRMCLLILGKDSLFTYAYICLKYAIQLPA